MHKLRKKPLHNSGVKNLQISISMCKNNRKNKEQKDSLCFLSYTKSTKCEDNIPLLVLNISSKQFYTDKIVSEEDILSRGRINHLPGLKNEMQQQIINENHVSEYIVNNKDVSDYIKVQMRYKHLIFKAYLKLFLISGRLRMFMRRRARWKIVRAMARWIQRRKVKAKLIQKWYKKQLVKGCTKTEELPSGNEEIKITYYTKNYTSTRITSFKQTPKNTINEVADNVIDERVSSALEVLPGEVESIASDQYSDYCEDINEHNEPHIINSVSVMFDNRDGYFHLSA